MGLLTIDITCPHCLREKAVIEAFGEKRIGDTADYIVAFTCRSCENGVIAQVHSDHHQKTGPLHECKMSGNTNICLPVYKRYEVIGYHPKINHHVAPENTPQRAAKFFIEAKDNFQRQRYETSVMLCRKVLDIATREILGEDSKNEQLSQRISMLFAKGKITEQMKDWAHIVRMDSNGAVHSDEEFSEEEANQMINFTEVFMIYSFTLPSMVAARQNKPEEQ